MSRRSSMFGVVAAMVVSFALIATAVALAQYNPPDEGDFDLTLDTSECLEPGDDGEGPPPCRDVFAGHLDELGPGDVLTIAPGTYDIGTVTVKGIEGEADGRIEVTALDPSNPPEIVGALRVHDSDHISFSHLDLVAAQEKLPAMAVQCGVGWELRDSTIRGASESGATANLNISGYQDPPPAPQDPATCPDEPRDFKVTGNCIREPYTDPELEDHPDEAVRRTRGFYHGIYVSFEGSPSTGGLIEGNRIEGSLNGAGIKLGNGATHERGPRNVLIEGNAFLRVRNMVILSEDVRNNTMAGNLVIDVDGPTNAGDDVVVYAARLREGTNVVSDNSIWGARWLTAIGPQESAEIVDGGGNRMVGEEEDTLDRAFPKASDGCVEMSSLPWDD